MMLMSTPCCGIAELLALRNSQNRPNSVVILGLGYCGGAIARHFSSELGYSVLGTTRGKIESQNARAGVRTLLVDGNESKDMDILVSSLQRADVIVATAPPGEGGDPFLTSPALKDAIEKAASNGCLIIYLSSVGVYGDQEGRKVTEETPPAPRTARAKRRLAAEEAWRQLPAKRLVIMRLPGIYGCFRGPVAKAREGNMLIVKEGHVFSRIHVDDVVHTCAILEKTWRQNDHLWERGHVVVLNCCDSEPAPQHEVSKLAYESLGRPVPRPIAFEKAELTEMQRSFYDESRFLDNQKLLKLVKHLKYPSYRIGVPACVKEEARIGAANRTLGNFMSESFGGIAARAAGVAGNVRKSLFGCPMERVALIDNGSLKPEATLSLRRLAASLEKLAMSHGRNVRVEAVSARFADRIPAHKLGGHAANVLPSWLQRVSSESSKGQKVTLLPLLIGPSHTLTKTLPDAARAVPTLEVEIAPCLVCSCPALLPSTGNGASEVAIMLAEHIRQSGKGEYSHVYICDHGSPLACVSNAREAVRDALQTELGREVLSCCMERRDGPKFDHCGPLLEDAMSALPSGANCAVALLFLQEGRHAGPGGDIATIVADVLEKRPDLSITTTCVLAEHTALIDLLLQRLQKTVPLKLWA